MPRLVARLPAAGRLRAARLGEPDARGRHAGLRGGGAGRAPAARRHRRERQAGAAGGSAGREPHPTAERAWGHAGDRRPGYRRRRVVGRPVQLYLPRRQQRQGAVRAGAARALQPRARRVCRPLGQRRMPAGPGRHHGCHAGQGRGRGDHRWPPAQQRPAAGCGRAGGSQHRCLAGLPRRRVRPPLRRCRPAGPVCLPGRAHPGPDQRAQFAETPLCR